MLMVIREPIIPAIPIDSFVAYTNDEPIKIAAERILPGNKIFDLDFKFND